MFSPQIGSENPGNDMNEFLEYLASCFLAGPPASDVPAPRGRRRELGPLLHVRGVQLRVTPAATSRAVPAGFNGCLTESDESSTPCSTVTPTSAPRPSPRPRSPPPPDTSRPALLPFSLLQGRRRRRGLLPDDGRGLGLGHLPELEGRDQGGLQGGENDF